MKKYTHDGIPIVDKVTKETMYGDTLLERKLNAFITKRYILSSGVPADECLHEAKECIKLYNDKKDIKEYLNKQFGTIVRYSTNDDDVDNIINIIEKDIDKDKYIR